MKQQVLWRKISRIIMMLSERLNVAPERALTIFYGTVTCSRLHDERFGLHLMGDNYIVNDTLRELSAKQS